MHDSAMNKKLLTIFIAYILIQIALLFALLPKIYCIMY